MRKLFFGAVPLIGLLVLGEVAVRGLWDPVEGLGDVDAGVQMVAHSTRIWALEPDSVVENFGVRVEVDEDGLRRGVEVGGAAQRWMVVGDSSFFGHGLAHAGTLHAQLSATLASVGFPTSVLCGAVPGYSVYQTRRLLDEVGWSRKPDVLVVGNLWSDNNFDFFRDVEWLSTLDQRTGQTGAWLWRSALLRWMRYHSQSVRGNSAPSALQRVSWIRDPLSSGERRVSIQEYIDGLDALIVSAAERGVGVVLVQPANRYRVAPPADEGVVPYTWDPYFAAQREVAEHRNVLIVDAAAALRAFGLKGDAAFLDEMHPTGKANEVIALAVATAAIQRGWPNDDLVPSLSAGSVLRAPVDEWRQSGRFLVNPDANAESLSPVGGPANP